MKEIFEPSFLGDAKVDIKTFERCINMVKGICHRVPLQDLLHIFQQESRFNQLFIRFPHSAAIIYCKTSKNRTYCGEVIDIPVYKTFNTEEFLAERALAGEGSRIKCILMPQGLYGNIEECFYHKESSLCIIPGYKYKGE